ncbi:hypothetical protein ACJRO7_025119 [Eucalyptus globulus]|uniref:Disease resistance protein RPS4B/Roq1-like leucine-rich repeats domain-containing protein n=1 Tax=Eucalyptus globulus TaxID=34317 RepID=A0ABD3K7W5_EUCGL
MDDNGLASSDSSDPNLPLTPDNSPRMLESFYRGEHHSSSFNTNFKHLKSINFADCGQFIEIPDFTSTENLERLILRGCNTLIKVHESVGFLPKLDTLDLHSCSNLSSFPSIIKLKSLQTFILCGCTKLKTFPHVGEYMTGLHSLCLEKSGVEELPSSIDHLVNLEFIFLEGCKNLTCLPPSMYKLYYLRRLCLINCPKLGKLPEPIEEVDSTFLPCCCSFSRSANFIELVLRNCKLRDVENLLAPQSFTTLSGLDLSENPFVRLPASIGRLLHLDWLCLKHCEQLQEISQLPPNIKRLSVSGCKSLRKFLRLSRVSVSDMKKLPLLELVDFSNCHNMTCFADRPSAECIDSDHLWLFYDSQALHQSRQVVKYQSHGSVCLMFSVKVDRAPSSVVLKSFAPRSGCRFLPCESVCDQDREFQSYADRDTIVSIACTCDCEWFLLLLRAQGKDFTNIRK